VSGRSFAITGIDRSDYMVTDLARAIAFYRDVLGLEPASGSVAEQGVEYELHDGSTFGLWVGGDEQPFAPGNGVMFAVDDLDAALAELQARGLPIIVQRETRVCRYALIYDSEGNVVNLHRRKDANDKLV
jgi:predicted enzyme related to lactoylglutathione lyase